MKKKVISCLLAVAMTAAMLAGCGSTAKEEKADKAATEEKKEEKGDPKAQLSAADYEFEKNYMFSDFNAHSNHDTPRQGIDTFKDNDIVFDVTNYEELIDVLNSEGNHLILFGGSWCHNTRAMVDYVNKYAKEYGVDKIYLTDWTFDNAETGNTFFRMTNGSENAGVEWNFLYGELINQYMPNMNDWIEFPSDTPAAITFTKADGKDDTIARAQSPILILYNKDNTVDNSNSGNGSKKCPVVYAYEKMVDRDKDGVYLKEYDKEGNEVTDDDGNPIKTYITEDYEKDIKAFFDYIKDNKVELNDTFADADYFKSHFDSLKDAEKINLHSIPYSQLLWLLEQDGNALIMFGGDWDEATQKNIKAVNDYAVANDAIVYVFDPVMDGNIAIDKWGYKKSSSILEEGTSITYMYTDLIEKYLTNLTTANFDEKDAKTGLKYTNEAGQEVVVPKATTPYLFSYNKAAEEDGFAAPVTAYSQNGENIFAVFQAYAEGAGIEAKDVK